MSEYRCIGSFSKQVKRVNDANNSGADVYSVTKYDGFVRSLDYFKKQVFSRDLSAYKIVKKGEFAYSTIHLDEGALGLLADEEALISPMYTTFEVDGSVDRSYISYLLKSTDLINQYGLIGQGSVNRRKSVPFSSLAEIEVYIPPLPEQKKIAEILSGIDREIELLDKRIQKLCIAKAKASEDILSSDRSEKKLFELSDCIDLTRGYAFKSGDYIESGGTRILRVTNIKEDGRVDLATNCVQILNQQLDHYKHFEVQENDLLLVMVGATTGKLGIVSKKDTPSLLNQNIWCLRSSSPTTLLQIFLHCSMPKVVAQHLEKQQGSARDFLTQKEFFKENLEIPNIDLQEKIVNATSCIDRTILATKQIRAKIGFLKFSLSSDLLSGRKRVSI